MIACGFVLMTTLWLPCSAGDWPCFRGPNADGVSLEKDWLTQWPENGPPVLWRTEVGTGYSAVVVVDNRLFTMGNRENRDTVYCLDASSGEELWKHTYDCPTDANEFEGGPTSTPTVHDGKVYTLSRTGNLFCFDAATGNVKWAIDVPEMTSIRIPGWGFSSAPWVGNGRVVVNVGDAGVAVDANDGSLLWKSADKDSGYSSFVPSTVDGRLCLVFGSARSYVCVEAVSGMELWRQRWLTTFGCNAANAMVIDEHVLISSGYNRGSALLEFRDGNPNVVWKTKEFQNQLSTSVYRNGHVFGANGAVSQGAALACLRLEDGEVLWNAEDVNVGGLSAAGKHLLVISDDGRLQVVLPGLKGAKVVSSAKVLDEQCWTVPVLCNGRIYVRGAGGGLVCLDVRLKN